MKCYFNSVDKIPPTKKLINKRLMYHCLFINFFRLYKNLTYIKLYSILKT